MVVTVVVLVVTVVVVALIEVGVVGVGIEVATVVVVVEVLFSLTLCNIFSFFGNICLLQGVPRTYDHQGLTLTLTPNP